MNDTKNKEKTFRPGYTKSELIILLQKVQGDFQMLDSKIEELLNSDNIDAESLGSEIKKLRLAYAELNEIATLRNKKIQELLKSFNS